MKVVGTTVLQEFAQQHADAAGAVAAWLAEARNAKWESPQAIKARYPSASFLADNRVVFNIKGNRYRLDTKVSYNTGVVVIVRVGTHAEYNHWTF